MKLAIVEIFLGGVEVEGAQSSGGPSYWIVDEETGSPVGKGIFISHEEAARHLESVREELEAAARAPLSAAEEKEEMDRIAMYVLAMDRGKLADDPEGVKRLAKRFAEPIRRPHSEELRSAQAALHARLVPLAAAITAIEPKPLCPCGSNKLFVHCHASDPHVLGIGPKDRCPCWSGSRFENCHGMFG